ncbi:hypothetical protein NE652_10640, partial [Bifidobacterium pseudocatenulatum]|nr:hypothetical protein [Bifidobacterium pseudocatenulatum]
MREVYVELNGRTVNVMELTREVLTEVVARHEGRNCSRAELLKWVVNGNMEYVIRLEDDIEDGQVFYTA